MTSAREHFKIKNTMVCLLKALEGKRTQVELRNENVIVGTIVLCDGYMNLTMNNVIFKPVKGKETKFTDFYVQGKQIRFVHIPDEVDIIKAMEQQAKRHFVHPPEVKGGYRGKGKQRGTQRQIAESMKKGGFAFGQRPRHDQDRGDQRL